MLEALTCGQAGPSELSKILLVPEQQQPALQGYSDAMCGSTDGQRSERFRRMSVELKEHIDMQTAAEKVTLLKLSDLNMDSEGRFSNRCLRGLGPSAQKVAQAFPL